MPFKDKIVTKPLSIKHFKQNGVVTGTNCHAIRHYDYNRGNLLDLGVAGQLAQIEAELQVTEEEESIHRMYFNIDPE